MLVRVSPRTTLESLRAPPSVGEASARMAFGLCLTPRCGGDDLLLQSGEPLSVLRSPSPALGLDLLEVQAEGAMPDLLYLPVANDGTAGAVEVNVAAGGQGGSGCLLELGPVVTAIAVGVSGIKSGAVQVHHDEGTKLASGCHGHASILALAYVRVRHGGECLLGQAAGLVTDQCSWSGGATGHAQPVG